MDSTLMMAVANKEISEDKYHSIRQVMLQASFRNAYSNFEKVRILLNSKIGISIQFACKICGISTKTYYRKQNEIDSIILHPNKNCPSQKLTNTEEKSILFAIEFAQVNCDCLNGQDIRKIAEDLYFQRTQIHCEFSRGWYYLFMSRYSDQIGKKNVVQLMKKEDKFLYKKLKNT